MSEKNCCTPETASCCCAGGCRGTNQPSIKTASTKLSIRDVLGSWRVRWGIGRMNYRVDPGLYALGNPDGESPVLVSANYKMTFDCLRKQLSGFDCWLLILDTKGVNVWCAAGKGAFGTDELVNRIGQTGLADVVRHRKLVLPQLGATGVSAHEVARRAGFAVSYGPVRTRDIRQYFASGCKATDEIAPCSSTHGIGWWANVGCASAIIKGWLTGTEPSCDCSDGSC